MRAVTAPRISARPSSRAGSIVCAALLCAASIWAASIRVEAQSRRTVGVNVVRGAPELDYSAADFADRSVREALVSGLPQTFVSRVYAYPSDGTTPIAIAARSCRVVYDIWEESYRVELTTESTDRTLTLTSVEDVVDACLVARHLRVGEPDDWTRVSGQQVYFGVLVELNPLTPDTVHRIRQWLAHPGGGSAPSEAFFGSFVSLFVNRRMGEAERTLEFRSQDIVVP